MCKLNNYPTPTYQSRKERDQKKTATDSPASATPTLVVPLLGRVRKESASTKSMPASKKKRTDQSPKASSKKESSGKPRSDELKDLDEN